MNRRYFRRRLATPTATRIMTQARAAFRAVLGSVLVVGSLVLHLVGLRFFRQAIGSMNFEGRQDRGAIINEISHVTASMWHIKYWHRAGYATLLIGGALVTHALYISRLRTRWFFWLLVALVIFTILQTWIGTGFAVLWLIALLLFGSEFFAPKGIPVTE
jgi:hypothetical protein